MADISQSINPLIAFDSMSVGEADPSFWSGMGATYGYQYGPLIRQMSGNISGQHTYDPTFDLMDHITEEELRDTRDNLGYLADAVSVEHLSVLRNNLHKMKMNRDTLARSGWGSVLLAGVLDPMNVFALPFKGATMGARALSGLKSGFVIGGASEAIRAPFDPTGTYAEIGLNIGSSAVMVGVLGGATGIKGSWKAQKRFHSEQEQLAVNLEKAKTKPFDFKDNSFVNSPLFKLIPTPFKKVLQNIKVPESTKKFMFEIGADGGLTANFNMIGQGIQSVWMLGATHMGRYIEHRRTLEDIWARGVDPNAKKAGRIRFLGTLSWGDSKSFKEFAERMALERLKREDPNYKGKKLTPSEREFLDEMDKFYTEYGVKMLDNGLLATKTSLTKEVDRLSKKMAKLRTEKDGKVTKKQRQFLLDQIKKLSDKERGIKALLRQDYDPQYKGVYFPRYFNLDKISANTDTFKNILKNWYNKNPYYTKDMQNAEKIKIKNEDRKLRIIEMKQLKKDIELKKYGKDYIKENPNEFKKFGGPYTDKQFRALRNLDNEIKSQQTKVNADEIRLDDLEVKNDLRIDTAVQRTIDKILNKNNFEDDDYMGFGLSKHLRHRELDIPSYLVADFIELNPADVAMHYVMRTGNKIEFNNKYGGASFSERLDDEKFAMLKAGMSDAEIADASSNITHMYDRVVGQAIHRPDSMDRRVYRALTDWTSYVYLGRAGLSSVPELGMLMFSHANKQGPLGWGQFMDTLKSLDLKSLKMGMDEVQLSGEALDIILGVAHHRMVEDYLRSPFNKGISKLNENFKKVFYTANGLAPITQITKQMAGVLGQHTLVERSIKWVAGTLDQEGIELMARYGLTLRDAKKIAKMPFQRSDSGKLILANTKEWTDDKLVMKFRASLNAMTRNTIINATPADKPMLVDGVVYARLTPFLRSLGYKKDKRVSFGDAEMTRIESGVMALPFQFWNFTLGATNKILGAGFDSERTGRMVGMASMLALGYFTLSRKYPYFEQMEWEDRMTRTIDATGMTGIYSDLAYMSLHGYMRMNDLERGDTFIDPKYNVGGSPINSTIETLSDFAGATPSYMFDIAETMVYMAQGDNESALRNATRMTPFSSLYGFRTIIGDVPDQIYGRGRY